MSFDPTCTHGWNSTTGDLEYKSPVVQSEESCGWALTEWVCDLEIQLGSKHGAVNAGKTIATPTQSIPLTVDSGPPIRFQLKVEQLSEVVAQGGDEGGVLPARTITGTLETVYAVVGLALHNNVALKGFKRAERYFHGVGVKPTWFRVVVVGAGWQVAD